MDKSMTLIYKEKEYELTELVDPITNEYYDIIAIFEVKWHKWDCIKNEFVDCNKEDKDAEDYYHFIDYYYGATDNEDILIKDAKSRIDYVLSKGDRL